MKCLSLWQPHASLLFAPPEWRKRVETRSWQTSYRGLLVIHAAKAWGPAQKDCIWMTPLLLKAWRATMDAPDPQPIQRPVLGAYLGIVTLDHIHPTGKFAPTEPEEAMGDYTPGRYAWLLRNAIAFPEPIPGRGYMGLYNPPAEVRDAINAAVQMMGATV